MMRKAQAAMEFLMTYGWAIIVVLAAIGALAYFGVLSPQKLLPEQTTFQAPLPNVDNAVVPSGGSTTTVAIAFKNNKGVPIYIAGSGAALTGSLTAGTGVTCTYTGLNGTYSGSGITAGTSGTSIPNGGTFVLTWACSDAAGTAGSKFEADLSFSYINSETSQTIRHTGSVKGKYQ